MTKESLNDSLLGQQLDEYRLEALLGRGGMARVYRGFDVRLERQTAILEYIEGTDLGDVLVAMRLTDKAFDGSDAYVVAKILYRALKDLSFNLILTGAQAGDGYRRYATNSLSGVGYGWSPYPVWTHLWGLLPERAGARSGRRRGESAAGRCRIC